MVLVCPKCGSTMVEPINYEKRDKKRIVKYSCRACNILFYKEVDE